VIAAPRVVALATEVPSNRLTQIDARAFARRRFADLPGLERLLAVFENTGIAERWIAAPIGWYEQDHDFPSKNALWSRTALALAYAAASKAIEASGIDRRELGAIVFVSTTGVATPSLDSHLVQMLDLSRAIARVPMWGLGCAGGAAGLARAAALCRGLDRPVLLVAAEICSATFVPSDRSKANLVATALFADGAAAAVLAPASRTLPCGDGPSVLAGHSHLIDDSEDVMGWTLRPDGLQVRFARSIPAIVRDVVPGFVAAAARAAGLPEGAIHHLVVHPGGAKVLAAYERALDVPSTRIASAHAVLRRYGNMSSPTALFVLDEFLRTTKPCGAYGLVIGLGPGFCAEGVVIRW
jgi:alkylresorcinol/alkylpyrone synthase